MEFLRYAVKRGHIIHGGVERLWKNFLETYSPRSVISYLDFNHTTRKDNFLTSLGFREMPDHAQVLCWSKGSSLIRETSLLTLGADRLLKTAYGKPRDAGLDNHGIMLAEGWLPVYTAGNRNFLWTE